MTARPSISRASGRRPNTEHTGDRWPAFLIITEEPNELVRGYHNRMHFALADDQVARWLDLSQPVTPEPGMLLSHDHYRVRPMHRALNKNAKDLDAIDPEADRVRAALAA